MLDPRRWLGLGACGYPLAALPAGPGGVRLCPECGQSHRSGAKAWRAPLHRQWLIIAGLVVMCGWPAPGAARWLYRGTWTRRLPAEAVVAANVLLGGRTPRLLRDELVTRVYEKQFTDAQLDSVTPLLLSELKDDDIAWNAQAAWTALLAMPQCISIPALEQALEAPDYQERQLAAVILRSMDGYWPSDACLRVTVEGLRDDSFPHDRRTGRTTFISNAYGGFEYLCQFAGDAAPHLASGLRSPDAQQRFLSAVVVGYSAAGAVSKPSTQGPWDPPAATSTRPLPAELIDEAIPVLVRALAENSIDDDAKQASAALVRMGGRAVAALEEASLASDPQQRRLAALILRRIALPGSEPARVPRGDPARITVLGTDVTAVAASRLVE